MLHCVYAAVVRGLIACMILLGLAVNAGVASHCLVNLVGNAIGGNR
jgi:hypothetical protein